MYETFRKSRFSKEYIRRIQFKMSILYPNSKKRIENETKKMLLKRLGISAAIIASLLLFDISFYWIIVAVFAVISINSIAEASMYGRLNIKILKQFEDFINDIIFKYRYNGILEEALSDAILEADYEIGIHGNFIYELITRDDYEDTLEFYKAVCPNNYFLLFYSMCYMVKQSGDKLINGKSLLVNNLNCLISDINIEVNKQEKINYMFSGLFAITLVPLFSMKPIELWSVSNIPELMEYYKSISGIMVTVVLSVMALLIFSLIKKMKYPSIVRKSKSRLIEYIASVPAIKIWQDNRINKNYSRYSIRNAMLNQVCSQLNVKEFEILQILYAIGGLVITTLVMKSIGWDFSIAIAIGIVTSAAAFYIPRISIIISKIMLKENIMSEITRFQATIIMCMYQDAVDVTYILNHMEMVAVYFKSIISKVIDEYGGSGIESLEKLKYEEKNKQFIRIIDGLIACDDIAVSEAFEFIEKDREYDMQRREIEEDRQLSNKVAIGKFISFIPIMATVGLKLILPFVFEGLNRIQSYSEGFTNMF